MDIYSLDKYKKIMYLIRDIEIRYIGFFNKMNYIKNLLVSLCFLGSVSFSWVVNAYEDYVVNLKAEDINFYVHTDRHINENIRNISTLYVDKKGKNLEPSTQNVCDAGLWLNHVTNSAAYSMILAAAISKSEITIAYSTEPGPWGNPNYCAIIHVTIN